MNKIDIFKVFSNETRLKIFEFLLEGKMCVSGIVKKLKVSQPTVTQHLKILQQIGLVKSEKIGYWIHYYVDKSGLNKIKNKISNFIEGLELKDSKCKISPSNCTKKIDDKTEH